MSLQINNLHITTATAKPKTPPGREFLISPALYGKTRWNLDNLSRMNISSSGQWTITPTTNFTANIKMWGGSGAVYGNGAGGESGAGGFSAGTASFVSGVPYVLVVGAGGIRQSGTGTPVIGGGGYMYYSALAYPYGSPQGGGMSGIFSGSYVQNRSIMIAGGGGSIVASYQGGAGGGSSGQDGTYSNTGTGGTQTAGGTGTYTGSALKGAGCPVSGNYNSAGGGGYFGGGAGGNISTAGGGSGYIHPTVVTNGYTVSGSYSTPGNSSDVDRGGSGQGRIGGGEGVSGRVIIS